MSKKKFLAIVSTIIVTAMIVCGFAITISSGEKTEKVTFYLVTNGNERDKNKAIADSVTAKTRGGAGYLYSTNGKNFVVLCGYGESEDAFAVAKRIPNSQVVELKISISKNPTMAETQKLGIEISNKLYDLSVDFDRANIDVKTLRAVLRKTQVLLAEKAKIVNSSDKIDQIKLLEFSNAIDNLLTCNEGILDWNLKYQRLKLLDTCT